jgi:phage tail sheath protein FI
MAKYSVPGIRFTEIDNTIRNEASTSVGVGGIVIKSNRGPVNQRILTHNYQQFTDYFGVPENLDDYGHFAAENYFANSNGLYAVRATMGDEAYAQIQYPYADAEAKDKYQSQDTASFEYIDNEDQHQLDLLDPLEVAVKLEAEQRDWEFNKDNNPFAAKQKAQFMTVKDLITDAAPAVAVFKSVLGEGETEKTSFDSIDEITLGEGQYVEYVKSVGKDGTPISREDDLIFTKDAWTSGSVASGDFAFGQKIKWTNQETSATYEGVKTQFTVPAQDTLNMANVGVTVYLTKEAVDELKASSATNYSDIFDDGNFFKAAWSDKKVKYCEDPVDALKLQFKDWDDGDTKTVYVEKETAANTVGQAIGLSFREYGMADKGEVLAMGKDEEKYEPRCKTVKDFVTDESKKQLATLIAEEYGLEFSDINGDTFSILSYVNVNSGKDPEIDTEDTVSDYYNGKRIYKLIYSESFDISGNDPTSLNEYLFWMYTKKGTEKVTTKSVYTASEPTGVIVPWQEGMAKEGGEPVNRLGAFPTSEILNSPDGTYRDGYTMSMESDDEPGNGDVEQYQSNKDNQLIITSIGPGKYGNDIGISIITAEAADIPALNHQNAFCWKYKYDDEDLVDKDDPNVDYTWKKVYRINVYAKTPTQTAEAAWGNGLDALLKDPIEWFLVSNDPMAKDGEGKSLFAPNVINGNSEYIYVSRNSVNAAKTGAGTYAQPMQTFAIYGLTGGQNSKKNLMSEKTQALKLYSDPQKADIDILFNVDAIDTFNGKQRYAAFQKKLADIASKRTMDLGIVQVTSMESKNCKRMLSEGKNFAFNNGSYILEYANYDKYYNSDLASYIYLPKSVAAACAWAWSQTSGKPWMAGAGTNRGQIAYSENQLTRLTDDEIGQLYDNNINTSRLCGNYGECLWGQKTALKKDSVLNRGNVRNCLNFIEKTIKNMMDPFLFEQNIPSVRSSAKNILDSFLSRVKAGGGIKDFATSVIADPDDEHIMLVNITLIPAEAIEFIDVRININRGTLTMEESTRPIG